MFHVSHVFLRAGVEFFHTWFAAEFDFLTIVCLGDGGAHRSEFVAADDACLRRVGLDALCGGSASHVWISARTEKSCCRHDDDSNVFFHILFLFYVLFRFFVKSWFKNEILCLRPSRGWSRSRR